MSNGAVIDMQNVHKFYGATKALDGLNLQVGKGIVAGFLGPNGAGKTTAIRILLGMLRHSSGSVRVLGGDAWSDAVSIHRSLAYVPGDVTLWSALSGGEAIDLLGRMRGRADETRRDRLIELFELDPTKKCRSYSKGNRQKVALIAALAADVDLYIFDEPTSGLDPLMERVFQDCVHELKDRRRTVLLSSHILAEVEILCDTVDIIRAGTIVRSGSLSELRASAGTYVDAEVHADPTALNSLRSITGLTMDRSRIRFSVGNHELTAALGILNHVGVSSLTCAPPSLEDLFLREYESDGSSAS